MKTIYKFDIPAPGSTKDIELPKGAEILCVQMQGGKPKMWALLNPTERENEVRRFLTTGTCKTIEQDVTFSNYIGTVQELDGVYIWHVFEVHRPNDGE